MKTLYLIGGPMGVGKTAVCNKLITLLPKSTILDGDECWNANKDYNNPKAQKEVLLEIVRRLNYLINYSDYEYIFFTWVMHKQEIIDNIINNLNKNNLKIITISLLSDKENLTKRINKDIKQNLRDQAVVDRSLERLTHFKDVNTIKIDTSNITIDGVAKEILKL